jgi:transcriptional regulator with AAA-type ATPase domain
MGTKGSVPNAPQLTEAQMRAAAEEAASVGKFTAAHCTGLAGAMNAIRAGVNIIEHAQLDEPTAEALARSGAAWCPTIVTRYSILHSALVNRPLVVANCALMNDKSWDFLLNHYNSPLNANGNTVYFQNFEAIPEQWSAELLAAIEETGLARRVRLLFSRSVRPEEPVSPVTRRFIERLGALTLELPPLRSRSDEIPSLSSLYLNSLNLELGKQLSGFEPRAIEMLRQYPWPNNYTQFKNLLRSLATLTNGPYIRSSSVADLLSKERSLRSAPAAHPAAVVSTDTSRTLESIIGEVVQQTVAAHGGNRAAAARQLGISRTTLWRYLGKIEAGEPTDPT